MHSLSISDCYHFIDEENTLSFCSHARLFNLVDIRTAKSFILFLQRNKVTVLTLALDKLIYLDSNAESFIYQVTVYFSQSSQRSLSLQVDSGSNLQNGLTQRLLLLNQKINVTFLSIK